MRPPKARRIVIAVYEGVSLLDLAGPLEAFRVASGLGGSRERTTESNLLLKVAASAAKSKCVVSSSEY